MHKDEHTHVHHHRRKRYIYPFFVALFFIAAFVFVSRFFLKEATQANDELIAEHIKKLSAIFRRINDCCKITGFRRQKDYIDFLNVVKFEGSMIGSMNLAQPQDWQGPYLEQNLSIEGKEYQIVVTKKGYYIIPGDGVKLANGQIIGNTLRVTYNTDIDALMRDPKALLSNDRPLAAKIETYQNPFQALATKSDFLSEETELTY
jgi:hypothetical protein